MRRIRKLMQTLGPLFALMLLAACSGIQVERMIPTTAAEASQRFDYTLKIAEPIGGRKSQFGVQDFVENHELHAALMGGLAGSGLFANVTDTGAAHRELHSEIITVAPSGGFNFTYAFVTQYWIVDSHNGEEVWRKGMNARHEVKVSESFSGSARMIKALEGAVRKNIEQLIAALSEAEL